MWGGGIKEVKSEKGRKMREEGGGGDRNVTSLSTAYGDLRYFFH